MGNANTRRKATSERNFGMKYVIKNCDNYTEFDKDWTCRSTIQNRKCCYCCQDCTDCVMKQIVELAKGHTELCKNCEQQICP